MRRCGTTARKACKDLYAAKKYFGGVVTASVNPVTGKVVTVRFYRKVKKRFVLKKTFTTTVLATKKWRLTVRGKKLARGTWYARATLPATATTTAAVSTKRYLVIT